MLLLFVNINPFQTYSNLKNLIHGEEDKMKVFTKKIKEELNMDASAQEL